MPGKHYYFQFSVMSFCLFSLYQENEKHFQMWSFPWIQHVLRGFDLASHTSPHLAESFDCFGGCLLPVLQWLGNCQTRSLFHGVFTGEYCKGSTDASLIARVHTLLPMEMTTILITSKAQGGRFESGQETHALLRDSGRLQVAAQVPSFHDYIWQKHVIKAY